MIKRLYAHNFRGPENFELALRGEHSGWDLVALPITDECDPQDPLNLYRSWLSRLLVVAPVAVPVAGPLALGRTSHLGGGVFRN